MNVRHLFLLEFFAMTVGIGAASWFPLFGVPLCLLLIGISLFLRHARQDEPRSVRYFIVMAVMAMVSLAFAIPYRWLFGITIVRFEPGLVSTSTVMPLGLWRGGLLLLWAILFHLLLRRYRFTEATARERVSEEVGKPISLVIITRE